MKKVLNSNKFVFFKAVFTILFMVSFFVCINAFADTKPFTISNAIISERSTAATGDINDIKNNQVENNVVFHAVGDYVIYKINIKNNLDKEITILTISDDNTNGYVLYNYDKHSNEKLGSNESFEFEVKASYKNELTDVNNRVQTSKVNFTIQYEYDGETHEDVVPVVPKTGDNISLAIIALVISSSCLIACVVLDKKKHKILKVLLIGLLLMPVVIKAATYTYDISIITDIKLFDKQIVTIVIGDEEQTKVVSYNEQVTLPDVPAKTGYNYIGWKDQNGNTFNPTSPIKDDLRIIAQYEAIKYDITYVLNGGSASNPDKYSVEDTITLTNPTKNGYTFAGWTGTDLTEPTKNVSFSNKSGDRTYTATYTATNYEIIYHGLTEEEENALGNPKYYTIEDSTITIANLSDRVDSDGDVYERFTGWTYNGSTSINVTIPQGSTGKKELTANFVHVDPDTYTITYNLNGGTVSGNPDSYTIKSDAITLNNPSKTGYNFAGWTGTDLSGQTMTVIIPARSTGDRAYEANYSIINYSISYNGITPAEVSTFNLPEDYNVETNTFTLPIPSRNGYTFAGWTGSNGDTPETTVTITKGTTEDKTYTAHFTPIDYSISYNLNGGTASGNPNTYSIETGVIVLTNPTKDGYNFTGWSGTDLTGDNNTTVTIPSGSIGDRSYEAHYIVNKYYVAFDANATDATGIMSNQEFTYNTTQAINANAYTRQGYIFNGWNTDPDGLGDSYTDEDQVLNLVSTGTITLYAQWLEDLVTLSFDVNGGNAINDITVRRGQSATLPTPTNDDTLQVFLGWYENLTDANPVTSPYTLNADTELIAKWSPIVCKKATSLHSDVCNNSSQSEGCRGAGIVEGTTYTYGNIIQSDTLTVGDALDCDVDGSGFNQRFYYLYTKGDNAVLIFSNNLEENDQHERVIGNTKNYIYSAAEAYLPTTSEWSNLPVTFGDKATRFPELADLITATGLDETDISNNQTKPLKDYVFLFENTSFTTPHQRSTYWLKEWTTSGTTNRGRVHQKMVNVDVLSSGNYNSSKNSVRPVIEVPTNLIEDTYIVEYDANGGTVNPGYASVRKGSSLGSVPTPTKSNKAFVNWYDDQQFTNIIDASHTPVGYETYYARFDTRVDVATLEYSQFDLTISETDSITFYENDVESRTYSSNDSTIASVDENGIITANAVGTTNIVITGAISGSTQVVTVNVQEEAVTCNLFFDENGGDPVPDMVVAKNSTIASAGGLPTPTQANYVFGGWFTDGTYTHEITNDTVIRADLTVIAKWIPSDAVAEINIGNYYTTFSAAYTAASSGDTIKFLKDFTLSSSTDIKKNLTIDLNNKTITSSGRAFQIFSNVEVVGPGTITTGGGSGVIDVVKDSTSTGELTMNSGTIINTRTANTRKQAIYVNGGIAHIGGTVYLKSNADGNSTPSRATVQCLGGGTIYITGGTIVNDHNSQYSYAVENSGGTVIIGTEDGSYDTSTPIIRGNAYGLVSDSNATFEIYDGIIMGKTAAMNNESFISGTETGFTKMNSTDGDYHTLYYEMPANQITITLDLDGGTLPSGVNDYINLTLGDQVGTLPTPTKGIYTFDGWYDENDQTVLPTREPTQNETYHAVWSYTPSDTPVSFNMTNDVMMDYYNGINTWKTQYTVTGSKTDDSGYTEIVDASQFETSMKNNFDAHNCSACGTGANINNCDNPTAGERCELPKGYDTGLSETVNVYEYNETTHEKTLITYTTSDNGVIYNMIPGKTYRWESTTDSNVYGYVAPTAVRRTIYSSARNVRDLGGMSVSFTRNNTTKTGTIKYGKLYRGAELSGGQADVDSITKLGVTREVDLRVQNEGTNPVRLTKHDKCDGNCGTLSSSQDIIITNYLIYPSNSTNYSKLRDTLKYVMESVVAGDTIYFHCTIGSDRTGTLAYFLEGLLGVNEEEKLEDYELSYFYGMTNRHRFHDNLSTSQINPRFLSMYKTYDTNDKIFNWYMYGLTDEQIASEKVLIEQFRDAMIDYD